MITKPTTFIVGAGASTAYGLPVAPELSAQAKGLEPRSEIFQLLLSVLGSAETLKSLLNDLKMHPGQSIDAYLEHRQHRPEIMRSGKALIAALMGQAMRTAGLSRQRTVADDDWLNYVLLRLAKDAPRAADFARGNAHVAFVTFNFDSIVEDRLAEGIRRVYAGEPVDEMQRAIDAIRIVHLHGRLPALPADPIGDAGMMVLRPGWTGTGINGEWIEWTTAAIPQIHLVMDEIDEQLLRAVQSLVHESTVVCCLGFKYDKSNLVKLGIPKKLRSDSYQLVFGSAFQLSPAERAEIVEQFAPTQISLGNDNDKCLGLLKRFYICRD